MPLVIIPLTVVIINDFIKCLIKSYKHKKFDMRWMFHSGGTPSGHSALATSVIMVTLFEKGSQGIEFMLAAIFGTIIMYDARGIRLAASKHAKALNKLQNVLLDESLGHTTSEVILGAFLGMVLSYLLWITKLFG